MSVNPVQSWLTPGSSLFASGQNFPSGINLNGTNLGGNGGTTLTIQPANEIFLGNGVGDSAKYMVSSISFANTIGTVPFLNTPITTAGQPNFRLTNLSTITGNDVGTLGSDINLTALASTLKVAFPGCVG